MTIERYFSKSRGAWPKVGVAGVLSEWMDVGAIDVPNGKLWAGDPSLVDDENGCVVRVPAGTYRVQVQGMDFKGHRRTARVRAWPTSGREPSMGMRCGETGTDSGWAGMCDFGAYRKAVTMERGPEFQKDLAEITSTDGIGVVRLEYGGKHVEMALMPSGLGDGTFTVFPLMSKGKTVGIEVEFLRRGFKLDRGLPGTGESKQPKALDKKLAREFLKACKKGQADVVKRMLKADPVMINTRGSMGLLNAVPPLNIAAMYGHAKVVELLLKAGHPVDSRNDQEDTPLMDAASQAHADVVRLLLKHKADVNARKWDKSTALHETVVPRVGKEQIVRILLEAGADPKARDDHGETALAAAKGWIGVGSHGSPQFADEQAELKRVIDLLTSAMRGREK